MRNPASIALAVALAAASAFATLAAAPKPPDVRASLVSEKAALVPGADNWIALRLPLPEHWHVYWHNPGDSGVPPRLEWRLPEGADVSAITWPAPKRIPFGPLANYGYEGTVVLPMRLGLSGAAAASNRVRIEATAHWLVCREACIPQHAALALELPMRAANPPDTAAADGIRAALATAPREVPGWSAVIVRQDDARLTLRVSAAAGLDLESRRWEFFPDTPGTLEPSAEQRVSIDGRVLTLDLVKGGVLPGPLDALRGVLVGRPVSPADGATVAIAIDSTRGS